MLGVGLFEDAHCHFRPQLGQASSIAQPGNLFCCHYANTSGAKMQVPRATCELELLEFVVAIDHRLERFQVTADDIRLLDNLQETVNY